MLSPSLEEKEIIRSNKLFRGELAVQERVFCDRVVKFISYILPVEFPAQCEKAFGLVFGTQTLTSIIIGRKGRGFLVRDNFLAVAGFCNYTSETEMIIGDIQNEPKAKCKASMWSSEFSIAKKLKKVSTGPVSPETLKEYVDKHYKKTNKALVVLMMDSGNYKNYSRVMKDLTEKHQNLYIIKMILIGSYCIKILRVFQGRVGTVNNHKFPSRWKLIKKKGWEYGREHSKEILGDLFDSFKR